VCEGEYWWIDEDCFAICSDHCADRKTADPRSRTITRCKTNCKNHDNVDCRNCGKCTIDISYCLRFFFVLSAPNRHVVSREGVPTPSSCCVRYHVTNGTTRMASESNARKRIARRESSAAFAGSTAVVAVVVVVVVVLATPFLSVVDTSLFSLALADAGTRCRNSLIVLEKILQQVCLTNGLFFCLFCCRFGIFFYGF
jgi:hypothetical protein